MVLYLLKFQPSDSIGTLATNGTHLYYDEKFVESLTILELIGGIAHEIMHCIFNHVELPTGYDDKLWNIACDLVINALLRQWGFILPDIVIFEFQGVHGSGKNAVQVYQELLQKVGTQPQPPRQPGNPDEGYPTPGDNEEPKNSDDIIPVGIDDKGNPIDDYRTREEITEDWKMAVASATEEAKKIGAMPGGLEELVQTLLEPKVNWVAAMRNWFIKDNTKRNWNVFQKRWFGNEVYLPKKRNKKLSNGIFVMDSSGSMTTDQLEECGSEMSAVLRELRPDSVLFLDADTRVRSERTYTQKDLPINELKVHGRGGTNFRHTFQYIEELDCQPGWLVYFTDLDVGASSFEFQPNYPVLWVCNDRTKTAPWGKVVYI